VTRWARIFAAIGLVVMALAAFGAAHSLLAWAASVAAARGEALP
jgi:hypothetical protein